MTSVLDHIAREMGHSNADDLRELNLRINHTAAVLTGLRRRREELLAAAEKQVDCDPAKIRKIETLLNDAFVEQTAALRQKKEMERKFQELLAADASDPGRDFWE